MFYGLPYIWDCVRFHHPLFHGFNGVAKDLDHFLLAGENVCCHLFFATPWEGFRVPMAPNLHHLLHPAHP